MPATPWNADTIKWLMEKRQTLGGKRSTVAWVHKEVLPGFLASCGTDPVLVKPGYTAKDDLVQVWVL